MPSELSIADCKPFSYQSALSPERIVLIGALESWDDEHQEILAPHHYLKRDGDLQEPMGSRSSRFVFACIFYGGQVPEEAGDGRTAYARYTDTVAFFRRNKRGTLTHPQLGQVEVAYEGLSAASRPAQEGDAVVFRLRLVEDQLDGTLAVEPEPGALGAVATSSATSLQSKAQAAYGQTAVLRRQFATFLDGVTRFYGFAYSFTTTAIAAYNAVSNDPSLFPILGALIGSGQSLLGELRVQGVIGVDAYPYASAARTTVAASSNLYALVKNRGPGTEPYVAEAPVTLQALCAERYGSKEAPAKVNEVLVLNPGFRGPVVAAGQRLTLPRKSLS